ncbi:MAG: hypothetical protein ABEJ22_06010 [Haloferacaceae archaeon]
MTDRDPRATPDATDDDALRLSLYELLHGRLENERRWQFWRLAAGHFVVGVILAYAFLTGRLRFVALTPILYGIVVMDGLKTSVRMLYLQQRLAELEAKLAAREPLFEWVCEYGHFGEGQRIEVWDVDVNSVPETAQYVLIVSIYVALVAAALLTWTPLGASGSAFGVGASRNLLLVGYATFTALFGVIVAVGYLHYDRVRERIAEIRGTTATPTPTE